VEEAAVELEARWRGDRQREKHDPPGMTHRRLPSLCRVGQTWLRMDMSAGMWIVAAMVMGTT
jgi:hypothetical protein